MGMEAATNVVLELGARGLFRVRDLKRRRISPNWMPFFEWRYGFVSHGRGVWSRRDFKPTRYELVQCRFPKSVFWGPSALWLLGHLDHEPSPLWLAIDNKARPPRTLDASTVIVRTRRLNEDAIVIRPAGRFTSLRVHREERARADAAFG